MTEVKLAGESMVFASPLFQFEVADAAALNHALVADARALRTSSEGVSRSNQHGWHSDSDLFERKEESFRTLSNAILHALVAATKRISPTFEHRDWSVRLEGWININEKGAFNTPHDHPGYQWSGCYYVRLPKDSPGRSGQLEFLDPRTNISAMAVPDAAMFSPKLRVLPTEGSMVIFPSYLRHWVYPNEQDEERISIAFNADFRRKKKQAGQSTAA